jgi:hypothetical protein
MATAVSPLAAINQSNAPGVLFDLGEPDLAELGGTRSRGSLDIKYGKKGLLQTQVSLPPQKVPV